MGLFATLSRTQKVSKTAISCQNNTKAVPQNRAAGRGFEKRSGFSIPTAIDAAMSCEIRGGISIWTEPIASISFRRTTRDQNNRDGATLRHVTTRSVTSHGERLGESHLQRVEAAPGTIRQPADRPSGRRINWSDTSNDSTPSGEALGRQWREAGEGRGLGKTRTCTSRCASGSITAAAADAGDQSGSLIGLFASAAL